VTSPDDREPTLLVIGAQKDSLGLAIADEALKNYSLSRIFTAGVTDEALRCDIRNVNSIKEMLAEAMPTYIVCTVGVNVPHQMRYAGMGVTMNESFTTNVIGPMEVLHRFITSPTRHPQEHDGKHRRRFVAISSNSARIPRTGSAPYCASKAALSMALRVAARELAPDPWAPLVWGYEPGLLAGTPMTQATEAQFGNPEETVGAPNLHRMKGVPARGLPKEELAERIMADVMYGSPGLNGCMFPFDAGEL
jgi:NAD(P)-dependent dehydrogenase (short-subunit alcohol dehydrogenase family)